MRTYLVAKTKLAKVIIKKKTPKNQLSNKIFKKKKKILPTQI